ncbi:hypothetical protein [Demequina sp.]|uniref:hypothetical protein n=1 Tax=Demequina sp. TaxID=2050685 RepID=UPI0025BD676D|nr:hypothetical protein [Demequina sp.]
MSVLGRISLVVLSLLVGASVALWAANAFPQLTPFGSDSTQQDTQVINAVTRIEQVALVSLAIEGITENRNKSELFGVDVPWSERISFIRYSFDAKLGLNGEDVTVTQTDEHSFEIELPEFIFIGHDEVKFALAAENNGVLSWVTADIDPLDIVNDVLDEDAQAEYLQRNADLLEEQAESFYRSLVLSVDPEADVTFAFAGE